MFGHPIEELTDAGAHENINLADLALDFDRQNDVWVVDDLELRVHQCLVKVKHESLAADL